MQQILPNKDFHRSLKKDGGISGVSTMKHIHLIMPGPAQYIGIGAGGAGGEEEDMDILPTMLFGIGGDIGVPKDGMVEKMLLHGKEIIIEN
jgi:hypothetical protein